MQVDLHEELREEVADLGTADEDWSAGLRPLRAEQERIRGGSAVEGRSRSRERHGGEASVVEDHAPRRRRRGALELKASRVDRRCFRIVCGAQVVEHRLTFRVAQAPPQGVEEQRPPCLGATVRAEARREQGSHGDRVFRRVRRDGNVGLPEASVQPVHVGLDGRQHAFATLPGLRKQLHLLGKQRLALGAGNERPAAERELDRADTGDVECGCARRPAKELQQEATVFNRHEACAVCDVRRRLARDVGNAPAIALDDEAFPWPEHPRRLPAQPQRCVLEAPPEVFGSHAIEERCQAFVELGLVVRVPVEDEAAVLPGRQDVERQRRVILTTRLSRGGLQATRPRGRLPRRQSPVACLPLAGLDDSGFVREDDRLHAVTQPSFVSTCATCVFTVVSLTKSSCAISALERPRAISVRAPPAREESAPPLRRQLTGRAWRPAHELLDHPARNGRRE